MFSNFCKLKYFIFFIALLGIVVHLSYFLYEGFLLFSFLFDWDVCWKKVNGSHKCFNSFNATLSTHPAPSLRRYERYEALVKTIGLICLQFVLIVANILLILGVMKERKSFMKIWIALMAFYSTIAGYTFVMTLLGNLEFDKPIVSLVIYGVHFLQLLISLTLVGIYTTRVIWDQRAILVSNSDRYGDFTYEDHKRGGLGRIPLSTELASFSNRPSTSLRRNSSAAEFHCGGLIVNNNERYPTLSMRSSVSAIAGEQLELIAQGMNNQCETMKKMLHVISKLERTETPRSSVLEPIGNSPVVHETPDPNVNFQKS